MIKEYRLRLKKIAQKRAAAKAKKLSRKAKVNKMIQDAIAKIRRDKAKKLRLKNIKKKEKLAVKAKAELAKARAERKKAREIEKRV